MFTDFLISFQEHMRAVTNNHALFETDIDKDALWSLYLDSFPVGTNPVYRTNREYDCSCCRHFLKDIGITVYFDDELTMRSIFEFDTGSATFQPVMDALAAFVKAGRVTGPYYSKFNAVGTAHSRELMPDKVVRYDHFFFELPQRLVHGPKERDTMDTRKSQERATHDVFRRSLTEITMEAIDTVDELIRSNTLYKGAEWARTITELRATKTIFDGLLDEKKDAFCWVESKTAGMALGRIRNHSIGVLLTDISAGMDLDAAVRRYEAIVAPANYKRPKAIFTQRMLEQAQATVAELGYMDSLPRRFATLDDITVNNILFANRDAGRRIADNGNVFDAMMKDVQTVDPRKFSRVDEIGIEQFINGVLPAARKVEALVEARHAPNMVSLIAPVNRDAKSMFKWRNGFSWAYAGNMTDSDIRENVKSAGGNVDGVLRFSIQWNDGDEYDGNDLDAHCIQPGTAGHIYFRNKQDSLTGGNLDVDIINPDNGEPAVENITWPTKGKMIPGDYVFFVYCYSMRGGRSGFRAEIEFDGQIFRFERSEPMRQNDTAMVATVTLHDDGRFTIDEHMSSSVSAREIWGVKGNQFATVNVIMYSPNYWDDQGGIGNKHYMFMLDGCKNPERPNGFYNEFLRGELEEHRRVFEALGSRMAVADSDDQLSGLGFSSTRRNSLFVKVTGSTERVMKINF